MNKFELRITRREWLQRALAGAWMVALGAKAAEGEAPVAPEPVSPLMRGVSLYIAHAMQNPLPDNVVEAAKHHLIDTLSAMVSGSHLLPGRKAIAYAKTLGGRPEACVAGTRIMTSLVNAALINGMLAHSDETDDSHAPSLTHPGCAIVPAALAMAERKQCNGTTLLRAVDARLRHRHPRFARARRLRSGQRRARHAQHRHLVRRRRGCRGDRRPAGRPGALRAVVHRAAGGRAFQLCARPRARRESLSVRRYAGAQRRHRGRHGGLGHDRHRRRVQRRAQPVLRVRAEEQSGAIRARPRRDLRNRQHQHQALDRRQPDPGAARRAVLSDQEQQVQRRRRRESGGARLAPGRKDHRQPQHAGHQHAVHGGGDAARRHRYAGGGAR